MEECYSGQTAQSRKTAMQHLCTSAFAPHSYTVQECDATADAIKIKSRAHKKILLLIIIIFLSLHSIAQQKITLSFKNVVADKLLNTDSNYTNQFGETFKVRNFKYYISNIVLKDAVSNRSQLINDYFLIDEKIDTSKTIVLTTSLQQITGIEFLLGVDSMKNVSGVQTGSLDPENGMFWTWNTGYVMAKLEGSSPAAKTPAHAFSYHIGGYKKEEEAARKISLSFKEAVNNTNKIIITADVLKWFSAVHDIKIADIAFCHEPGKLAMQLADNYATMFSIAIEK